MFLLAVLVCSAFATDVPAAVVQYTPFQDNTKSATENMEIHASAMLGYLETAVKSAGAKIVVFPELSLGYNCSTRNITTEYALLLPGMNVPMRVKA